ncbi:hypothetical protein GGX14DRAFT_651818 [Mycena pura]|uniref:Uncharacterized protein n=1 Tax=Mycena pura TaxID=153505 RepID=A0AAD6V864_9AGAR|nr:hypothetical protein GGX14DRAFT_651818 [Mycena pura]
MMRPTGSAQQQEDKEADKQQRRFTEAVQMVQDGGAEYREAAASVGVPHTTRRHPELRSALSHAKDVERGKADGTESGLLSKFYSNMERAYQPPYSVKPENLYNIDEKGFMLGISSRERVLVFRLTDLNRHLGRRPNGPEVPQGAMDTVARRVHTGKRPNHSWIQDSKLDDARLAPSPNGWTDNELGCRRSLSQRLLSALTATAYQVAYSKAANFEEVQPGRRITKRDFTKILPKAREAAFTRTNIQYSLHHRAALRRGGRGHRRKLEQRLPSFSGTDTGPTSTTTGGFALLGVYTTCTEFTFAKPALPTVTDGTGSASASATDVSASSITDTPCVTDSASASASASEMAVFSTCLIFLPMDMVTSTATTLTGTASASAPTSALA